MDIRVVAVYAGALIGGMVLGYVFGPPWALIGAFAGAGVVAFVLFRRAGLNSRAGGREIESGRANET